MTDIISSIKLGLASLSSPLEVGAERAPQAAKQLADLLRGLGCEVLSFGSIETADQAVKAGLKGIEAHIDAFVFSPVCWYEDYYVLDFIEECPVPLFFWPLPGMETGALCGVQQQVHFLKKLSRPLDAVFGEFSNTECLERLKEFLRAVGLHKRLRRARIGFGGHRVVGMTDTAIDEHMLKKTIGPRVVPLDLPEIINDSQNLKGDQAADLWKTISGRAAQNKISDEEGTLAMATYLILKKNADRFGLDAMTIGCYPHLMGIVCLAASLLSDDGIPMSCEGDLNGAVGMLMLSILTGGPTHSTDWLEPLEDGSIICTHCGSGSFDLAESKDKIVIDHVRLMDRGGCVLFPTKPGPVTFVGTDPIPGGYRIALMEGEAIKTDMVFPGNPVRTVFDKPMPRILQWIFDEGIGHHWMIGHGHVSGDIKRWAGLTGQNIKILECL